MGFGAFTGLQIRPSLPRLIANCHQEFADLVCNCRDWGIARKIEQSRW